MEGTWTKLRSGEWGARVETTSLTMGAKLTMRRKDGATSVVTIDKIVWQGQGVSVCAVSKSAAPKKERTGCSYCCRTATRTAQIWEDCPYCGNEPIYQ